MGGWWIGKDTKENCLGLLQNTISGVAGVTEEKYQWQHNTQFRGQVLNHTSPDSKSRTLPLHEPAQWHCILWLLVTSTVEKLSALIFCLEHEIIMLLWNASNLQTYYGFWYLQWLLLTWCFLAFLQCSSFSFFWVSEGHTASIFRVTEFVSD
jgi:hypothetical protein